MPPQTWFLCQPRLNVCSGPIHRRLNEYSIETDILTWWASDFGIGFAVLPAFEWPHESLIYGLARWSQNCWLHISGFGTCVLRWFEYECDALFYDTDDFSHAARMSVKGTHLAICMQIKILPRSLALMQITPATMVKLMDIPGKWGKKDEMRKCLFIRLRSLCIQ